jgi:2-keto-4-pentenoate hydratase
MSDDIATEAAGLIFEHWRAGTRMHALPPHLTPRSDADGHAIQAALTRLSGAKPVGWKIAATSAAGQAHIGVSGPLPGRLHADHCYEDGATLPFGGNAMQVIEAEFAFVMGRTLSPRPASYSQGPAPYSQEDVVAAVDRLHLALEIPDSRFEDFAAMGGPALIADNACAHDFVLGPVAGASWRDLDLAAHPVTLTINGNDRHEGIGANVLGDPRIALTWLVNTLSGIGVPLESGQIVTTGTCIVPAAIKPGDHVEADFGQLGAVTAHFAER